MLYLISIAEVLIRDFENREDLTEDQKSSIVRLNVLKGEMKTLLDSEDMYTSDDFEYYQKGVLNHWMVLRGFV